MNRVVVTGLGVVSPAGCKLSEFWSQILDGISAIRPITLVSSDLLDIKVAAEVVGFEPSAWIEPKRLSMLDRFSQFAIAAAQQALVDARLVIDESLAEHVATIVGSGVGGQNTLETSYKRIYGEGNLRAHPLTILKLMINAPVSNISIELGLKGPSFAIASACASGTHAIGEAFFMVRSGRVKAAVAGGSDACLTLGTIKAWEAMRVLSQDTCRPFCRDRSGTVLGEGSAICVLETLDDARARGAQIYAEVVGFGMGADGRDMVLPDVAGVARVIDQALKDAKLELDSVDYVNAHGTGTIANDIIESRALQRAFGSHARHLAISSSKAVLGHGLGAAGALEFAVTVLAVRNQVAPPTANFTEKDPECDLDYVPNEARQTPIRAAISSSLAFGGLNAVLVVRPPPT
jgi:nodulation protein E